MLANQSRGNVSVKHGGSGSPGYLAEGGAAGQRRPLREPFTRTAISYLAFVIPASRFWPVISATVSANPKTWRQGLTWPGVYGQ